MNRYIFESMDQTKQFVITGFYIFDLEIGEVMFFNDKPFKLKERFED